MNFKLSTINFSVPKSIAFRDTTSPNVQNANNSILEKSPQSDSFEMSVGYVNDMHGQTNNMMRILTGIKADLKLSGGDNDIGDEKNGAVHRATTKFLNIADIKGSALGNHELDTTQKDCIDSIQKFDGDFLAVNFSKDDLDKQDPKDIEKFGRAELDKHLKKSKIVDVKGEKIGLIGASPMDLFERLTHPDYYKDCYISDLDDTIESVQEEVDNLKKQDINKIILLSHLGYKRDKVLAENTDGIDVIIGGHTHELIKDITEGENLLYSKSGEPVIITEAGKDGNYFGKLNLTFDKDGVITRAQNNLGETRIFHKNMINQYVFDEILGVPDKVGYVLQAPPPPTSLIEENPHANFVCDVMKETTDADIALWHNCGVRNFFHEGVIDSRDVKDIAPFLDQIAVANVSEKTIVEMFKHAIEATYENPAHKPGLIAVSGLNYTVNPQDKELKAMNFIDKNGNKIKIDVENPREDKKYKVVCDEFLMSAGADYDILATEEEYIEKFPYDKDVMVCNYLKKLHKPIIINHTGRIHFENDD